MRLWTVKEAAFKSHPENADLVLSDFAIGSLNCSDSFRVSARTGTNIRVHCTPYRDGFLSIAGKTHGE